MVLVLPACNLSYSGLDGRITSSRTVYQATKQEYPVSNEKKKIKRGLEIEHNPQIQSQYQQNPKDNATVLKNLHTAISDTVQNTEETKGKIVLNNKIYKYSPIHQILRRKLLVLYPNLCNQKKRVVFKLHLASISSENETAMSLICLS